MVYPNCDPVPEIEIGSLQCQLDTHSELNNGHVPSPKIWVDKCRWLGKDQQNYYMGEYLEVHKDNYGYYVTLVIVSFDTLFSFLSHDHLGEGNGNPLQYSCLENSMEEEPGRL